MEMQKYLPDGSKTRKEQRKRKKTLTLFSCNLVINSEILIPPKVYLGDCHVCVSSCKFKLVWFVIKSRGQ